ncbi:MAG: reverse transcriptase family protein [Myxococcaceae bacterium]
MQRKLLHDLLERVPFHSAAHGGVRGRSAVTHASLHSGRRIVAQFDLADFFPSITFKRVFGFFVALGYRRPLARDLAALTTTSTPSAQLALRDLHSGADRVVFHQLVMRLRERHLPQGAPTSPALANHLAFMLDQRLSEAATSMGLTYSRYVDDLAFSGDVCVSLPRLERLVESIVLSEGFALRHRKSRLQTSATRQRVTGLVVNEKPQTGRKEFDRFRALLHQQAKAPTLARAELEGRAEWFSTGNPTRRAKLRRLLDAINSAAASPAAGAAASTAAESQAATDRAR